MRDCVEQPHMIIEFFNFGWEVRKEKGGRGGGGGG